ncbi:hypothetical protein OMP38_10280 [Cohnella ginsengisoli]|uniref:Uncharacterized protein n=1 Tax=Cohnella ginsengisoli TaxID=425004 RepID=A0A9X4QMH1_9BACL|nr:hypothetical protein [Cohnella ginsengisoli]MDG0791212.1 hypothetical protein [Cohnella ginsengisoli]
MKHAYYRLSLKKRIQLFYILLTVFCIFVTGILSDYFASRVMERNALGLSQNTLNKSAQALDEHLRHVIVSSYTLMLSDAFVQTMIDVQSKNDASYYRNLSALQVPFVQLKLNEPLVESVLLSTPIGEFYATKDTRSASASADYRKAFGDWLDRPSWSVQWIGAHADPLFVGGKRVLSLLLRPLSSQYSPDVYLTVNLNESLVRGDRRGQSDRRKGRLVLARRRRLGGRAPHPSVSRVRRGAGFYERHVPTYREGLFFVFQTGLATVSSSITPI